MNEKRIKKENIQKLLNYLEKKDHAVSDKKSSNNKTKAIG